MSQTFKKQERLCSKKLIAQLFERGTSLSVFPIRAIWLETGLNCDFPAQVVVSVPKKKIKKAVERNSIKRRMRESYRKNKHLLYEQLENYGKQIALVLIYQSDEEKSYEEINDKIIVTLQRLAKKVE
ncbi:MAG: ribonuclease P protein component [Flavobacteriales bacterium]|nr:MAG: ribonuclease P protein component [Flavobacteriales bacterium]